MKIRLDQYLVQNGLVQSRERAKALIMAGVVFVNQQKVDKAGEMIKEDAVVEVRGHDIGYVSRGGLKLEKAMKCFPLTPNGKVCMDIGASTGGFTDCMLQNGAVKVYAVDVGYGQLAWSLRTDARVVNMERTNIRYVTPEDLAEPRYMFSAMGFYPVDPVSGNYVFGAPQMPEIVLNLADGKTFTIIAEGLSKEHKYVDSITLNGEPYTKNYISHEDILKGGTLVYMFKAEVYILKKEEGGRHTPFHNKYRPQFYLRTMDCTGEITLPEGTEMVMPGDNVTITVELIYPVALNVGLRFAIREGGRTVGAGQITELLD